MQHSDKVKRLSSSPQNVNVQGRKKHTEKINDGHSSAFIWARIFLLQPFVPSVRNSLLWEREKQSPHRLFLLFLCFTRSPQVTPQDIENPVSLTN